ncbi:MAG: pre-peptidase C-terminal domain-containing protein [Deltaproteobacteria bacterium]|nr:pre-peptidase C-terminal domain-containing protein [Nannocystaceae bacterium]
MISSRHCSLAASLLGAIVLVACKDGGAPVLQDPGDQTAVVGQTLTVDLLATDPDGDDLDYRFAATGVPDLATTTTVTIAPDGHGVFTFTPLASQLGSHLFDFVASDGDHDSKLTIAIDVVGAGGNGTQPIFRKPLGNGTVLDLEQSECVEFDVQLEDQDSTSVVLEQLPPLIQDAELTSDESGLNGRWTWCPNREQLEASDRYDLTLSAQDAPENPPILKDYTIVLRRRAGTDCPGEAPAIEHTVTDHTGLLDLAIEAHVSDDQGIKNAPILLYAYEDPGEPIDYTKLTVVTMDLTSGDMQDGQWRGWIPNPTAPMGEGAEADVWYVVSVNDDDDAEGDCDHLTDSPEDGTHVAHVVNDGTGNAGVCGACSFDVQCGSFSNLCLAQESGNFCGTGCASDAECEEGYVCTPTEVQSVEGSAAQQCVPLTGSCVGGGDVDCEEDDAEDNDAIDQAVTLQSLAAGESYTASLCDDTNDWYRFDLDGQGAVTVTLSGPSDVDIDLAFTDAEGVLLAASTALQSDESLTTACVEGGTYYVRIYAPSSTVQAEYTFALEVDGDCGGGGGTGDCCTDTDMPGCEDPEITECVCAIDSFCCDNEWDNLCAGKAQSECGLDCGGGTGHDCCTAGESGCDDATVQACVCAGDPFCCETEWDATCVEKVGSLLCDRACEPDDADGACCEAHPGTTGCEVDSVEACVCAMDDVCCNQGWDQACVAEIEEFDCGTCP